jgi:hypothetical protein
MRLGGLVMLDVSMGVASLVLPTAGKSRAARKRPVAGPAAGRLRQRLPTTGSICAVAA